MHLLLPIICYYVFLHISLLIPGYIFVRRLRYFADRPGVELSLGYAITLLAYFLLAGCVYAFDLDPRVTQAITWVALLVSVIECIRGRHYLAIWNLRFPLLCLVLMSVLGIAFLGYTYNGSYHEIPDPQRVANAHYNTLNVKVLNVAHTAANDNYIPYRQAQFFINRSDPGKDSFINEWGVSFFERTPLMGAVTANYFNLFRESVPIGYTWNGDASDPDRTYLQFQILASLLNNLFIVPAFFFLTHLFRKRTALLSCLFLVLSQFFLYNTVFSWPKSLVIFFVLSCWLILFTGKRLRDIVAAGLLCAGAYLTHDLAILYIGATVLYLLSYRRLRDAFILATPSAICALSWLLIAKYYHQQSSFIYYPLSVKGIPPANGKGVVNQFLHTSLLRIAEIRFINLLYLLTPYQLFTSEGGHSAAVRTWAVGIFSVPGAVGIGLLPALVAGLLKRLAGIRFWILALGPILFEALFIGWPKGLGALHFAGGTVVLLTGLSVHYLTRLKRPVWVTVIYGLVCLQYGFLIAYSYNFTYSLWFAHPLDLLIMMSTVAIMTYVGWAIYQISHNKNVQLLYD